MYSEWVKRLGQQHWSKPGSSETLCGIPMLGNNYANSIPDDEKKPCEKCAMLKEGNTNCLSGMRCPNCGSLGPFKIISSCLVEWTDDGTDNPCNFEFNNDAPCRCVSCDMHGKACEFMGDS